MKPILLQGHERALTQIVYNRDGDLLFTVAKDNKPCVWHTYNGERLGTLNGHTGACWCLDVNWDSSRVVSGAADNSCLIWDTETGKFVHKLSTKTAVRTVNFDVSGNIVVLSTDATMGKPCTICWLDTRDNSQMQDGGTPYMQTEVAGGKVTTAAINAYNEWLFTGHEDGKMMRFDFKSGKLMGEAEESHDRTVMDVQLSKDRTMLISASKDSTAKLWDASNMTLMKTYKTKTNVNSAAISPIFDQVILGGGQEAMQVTTTSTRSGNFEVRFFHLVYEAEIGSVKGHFGPINTVAFHPDGKSFASGGEDGFIRLHTFDPDYYKFKYTI